MSRPKARTKAELCPCGLWPDNCERFCGTSTCGPDCHLPGVVAYPLQLPADYHELREKAARLAETGQLDHPEPDVIERIGHFAETGRLYLPDEDRTMREAVLDDAKELVASTRNEQYGEPIDNFGRWAGMLQALGYRGPGGRDLLPHDIAVLMTCGKLSRAVQTPDNAEHWTDGCGYLANGFECVTLEDQ